MKHNLPENKSLIGKINDVENNVGSNERLVSSVTGGALIAYGIKQGGILGLALSAVGGGLLLRGATGHCHLYDALDINTAEGKNSASGKINVNKSVTIEKSPEELYAFWRNFENLPRFMSHLESVKKIDNKRSYWKAKAPLGSTVEWEAEITQETENKKISWQSIAGSDVPNSGSVEFLPTANRGTQVKVTFSYEPPAGKIGALIAKLFGEEPNQQVADDLRRFKQLMESGTIMTIEGQPSGAKTKTASV